MEAGTAGVRVERAPHAQGVMRAAVIEGPEQISIVERPVAEPGTNQVRIRMEGCGVCGSNLPVWEGRPWFSYPIEPGSPGHEGWGVIDAVGVGVTQLVPGQRVAALSYHAFATHDVADASAVVPLPETVNDAFPGEPLACALNVIRRANVQPGERVAIVGIGYLGALLTTLAVERGARVFAASRRAFARAVAIDAGAEAAFELDEPHVVAEAVDTLAPGGCDCVIEAVGTQRALDVASGLVRTRGRLVVAGYHQDGLRQVNMQDWNWKGIDVINAHERDPAVYVAGLREAVDMVASGRWKPGRFLTHRFELDELPHAMRLMRERPDGFLKAIVTCE